jgi:hypothetical protein
VRFYIIRVFFIFFDNRNLKALCCNTVPTPKGRYLPFSDLSSPYYIKELAPLRSATMFFLFGSKE